MLLKTLTLTNFRNYFRSVFSFSPTVTVIIGSNASGKTNLLEAIFLLSIGRSFRAENEKEMISYGKDVAGIEVKLEEEPNSLKIILTTGLVLGKKTARKKRLVNGIARRLIDFVGNMPAVLFWPQDLDLVTDSPSLRRSYLNNVLSLVDRDYRRAIAVYEKGLVIRNKLLRDKREFIYEKKFNGGNIESLNEQINYWGEILITNGNIITKKREEYLNTINQFSIINDQKISKKISGKARSRSAGQNSKIQYQVFYDKSEISPARLDQYKEEEVLAGNTLVGPHRDDFIVSKYQVSGIKYQEGRELAKYGSRGEQRLGVLWLKLAELSFVEKKLGVKPILLLDDILSELDEEHRQIVMQIIPNQQTVVTTTDKLAFIGKLSKEKTIILA